MILARSFLVRYTHRPIIHYGVVVDVFVFFGSFGFQKWFIWNALT